MITVTKEVTWEMAHRLAFHQGLCRNLHGHSYKLQVTFCGTRNDNGMVIDFGCISKMLKKIAEYHDHACMLNMHEESDVAIAKVLKKYGLKVIEFVAEPTAENMITIIGQIIKSYIECDKATGSKDWDNIALSKIRLYETATSYAEVIYG